MDHPTHSRFCGISWEDADTNCNLERHCPTGESSECPEGEECFSFLTGCNYVDMIGGPPDGSGGEGNSSLGKDDPSRSNYCGVDWNDAISNCDDDGNWCPSGADADCPEGKLCFAGTDCKYVSDIFPTGSPSDSPTFAPTPIPPLTQAPVVYGAEENTRFCGTGWEDVSTTCRIGSHCPSGQECFTWILGCNIVDFEQHLNETGQEIFGADHWLIPPEGLPGLVDVTSNGTHYSDPQLPPASILANIAQPTPAPDSEPPSEIGLPVYESPSPSLNAAQPTPAPDSEPQSEIGLSIYESPSPSLNAAATSTDAPARVYGAGENNIFCGASWPDASERCSPETFCSDGAALHKCENANEFCFVGVTACDANDWMPTASPTTASPSAMPTERVVSSENPTSPPTGGASHTVSSDSSHTLSSDLNFSSGEEEEVVAAIEEEEEAESASTIMRQSYCATDYVQLMSSCATLITCNREPCPDGYTCFTNAKCTAEIMVDPVPSPVPTPSPTSSLTPSAPIMIAPISETFTPSADYQSYIQITFTDHPTLLTLSDDEVAQRLTNMNSYCATSLSEVLSSCSYALHTCNMVDSMCGDGTHCFEDIVCPDPQSITTAQTFSTPSPLSILSSIAPTANDIETSYDSFTSAPPTTIRLTSMPTSPITLGSSSASPTTIRPTSQPISPASPTTIRPTLQPISPTPTPAFSTGGVEENIQNYCAKSKQDLVDTCASAPTCNAGNQPCPAGTYCFGNYVCQVETNTLSHASIPNLTPAPVPIIDNYEAAVMTTAPESASSRSEGPTVTNYVSKPWEVWESNENLGQGAVNDNWDHESNDIYPLWQMNNSEGADLSINLVLVMICSYTIWMRCHN